MISELDIFRAANVLIGSYGAGAVEEARRRAEGFADDGDQGGQSVWLRIARAVEALQLKDAPPVENRH